MENNKQKKGIIFGLIGIILIASCIGMYYYIMSNRAAEIDSTKGQSFSETKKLAVEKDFSVKIVKTDKNLIEQIKHEDEWTVSNVKSSPWKRETKVLLSPSPKAVAMAFLDSLKDDDQERIKNVYEGGEYDLREIAFVNDESTGESGSMDDQLALREDSLYPRLLDFEYKIVDEAVDGDTAKVTIDVTTYNIGSEYSKAVGEYFSEGLSLALSGSTEEQLQAFLVGKIRSHLESLTTKDYTKSVDINLKKKGDTWIVNTIKREDKFTNVITGGLRAAIDDLDKTN